MLNPGPAMRAPGLYQNAPLGNLIWLEDIMSETPVQAPEPDFLCEKCRHRYPANHFDHGFPGLGCVCRRCMRVMGYAVKDRL